MVNKYIIAALVGAGALVGVWLHGNSHGKESIRAEYVQNIEKARKKSSKLADELELEKQKIKVEYRDRVKKVYIEDDASGCLDAPISDSLRQVLRGSTD